MMSESEQNSQMDHKGSTYIVSCCDTETLKVNLDKIQQQLKDKKHIPENCSPIFLSSRRQLTSISNIQSYPQYFATLCRQYGLLKNDRLTLLSPMDHLIAIQLCFAEKNKQDTGDFDVETSVVLQASKDIVKKKLLTDYDVTSCTEESGICDLVTKFMDDCGYTDAYDVFVKVKDEAENHEELKKLIEQQSFIFLDMPKTLAERKMMEYLSSGKPTTLVNVEVPLDCDEDVTVSVEDCCLATLLENKAPLSTAKKPPSITEGFVRLVYLSYLDLLVNSRSEISLARVFNVPERELTHEAFTALKHHAQEKKMTMYQSAMSYVMKIRLGGKGYAPDRNTPLGMHIKGIGELVTLMQRMETVVEEDPDIRSACKRVVNILRREMLKCRDSKIRNTSVDSVADHLQSQVTTIIDNMDAKIIISPEKPAANGGSLTSRRARKALRHLLDKLSSVDDDLSTLDHLTDIYSSQRTPLRFPSVLSQFRSPVEELDVTSPDNKFNLTLKERVMNKINKQPTPIYMKRYRSEVDWAEPVHDVNLQNDDDPFSASQVFVIPTKTIVHAGSKFSKGETKRLLESILDQENVQDSDIDLVTNNKTVTDDNNDKTSKVSKKVTNKPNGKKTENQSKKRPLDEGNQSSQPQKKKKAEQSKVCRRKLLPPVKGQKPISQFFRV